MIVICDVPVPVTISVSVTLIVSTVESSDVLWIVIFPLSVSTFSLKLRTIVASSATSVASSSGTDEVNVGIVLVVVKLRSVVELIPAYEPLSTSSKAVASIWK